MATRGAGRRTYLHPREAPTDEADGDADDILAMRAGRAGLKSGAVGPDLRHLQTGDIVLIAGTRKRSRPIQICQASYEYPPPHCVWTHAALFLAGDRVVHARPAALSDGVVVESLFNVWTEGKVAFLRWPDLTEAERLGLGVQAARRVGLAYDRGVLRMALSDFAARRFGQNRNLEGEAHRITDDPGGPIALATSTTCVRLVLDVYQDILGDPVRRPAGPSPVALPADLAMASAFLDAEVPLVRY
jgi:hypothetical protein